ncbi:MAG: sugar-binding domain-containing protein, partial [Kiritimatiellales bacterium]
YTVPARLLKPGKNHVAICVYNNKRTGGFLPPKAKEADSAETVGPFSSEAIGGTHSGFTVGGTGWYRKHFKVDAADAGKHLEILFGGIYMNSDVWINGQHLGFHPYGYTSIYYDLTPHIKPGADNVIAVRVRNEGVTSRWYPGSGIYRNVWLTKTSPTHIRRWGVRILTPEANEQEAKVVLNTEIEGDSKNCALRISLVDENGKTVSEGSAKVTGATTPLTLTVKNPKLWSADHPYLHTAKVQLVRGKDVVDEVAETFGIRTVAYSVDKGLQINGKTTNMWGGCVHHDNGLLGSAAFDRAEYRKLEIMKQNGYNAVRAAHNPMSDAFYAACDRLGLLVLDEVFDMWDVKKTPQDYGAETFREWHDRDLELWLRRTRNHPSIVIRSLGNEIGNREKSEDGLYNILAEMKTEVAKWDPTLPVTGGTAQAFDRYKYLGLYDVKGYNYREDKIDANYKIHPEWIVICTESFPSGNAQLNTWNFVNDRPWVTGSFVWSAFEYIGESWSGQVTLNGDETGWPSYAAACGLIDITGIPKGGQLYRNVINNTSDIEILILEPPPAGRSYQNKPWSWPKEYPYWGWDGLEGKPMEVKVVSRAPEMRLKLNGKVVGTGTTSKDSISNVFKVPYEPGELVAEGLKDGQVICSKTLTTPGKPVALRLTSDRSPITANRTDLAFVSVETVDANGRPVMAGRHKVRYTVDGAGTLEACGSGLHTDVYGFRNPGNGTTWRGRSMAILRPSGTPGEIRLTVESDDFPPVQLKLPVQK